jgi:hypothetical protein
MHTIFWLENLEVRDHLECLGIHGKIINIRMELREIGWEGVNECIWLKIGTSSGPL